MNKITRNLTFEIDEKGTGYYIIDVDRGTKLLYQYPPYIPFERPTIEESAQAHIDEIVELDAAAEQERVTIEDLQKELDITKMAIDELMMMTMEGGMM